MPSPNQLTILWRLILREVHRIAQDHSLLLTLLIAPCSMLSFMAAFTSTRKKKP
ncbi:hypothetical protein [Paraflavitalea speifideaquila]|uniref:hypothetical protein n=1 Tax=Paraflavitalea speifideaquila TaxID=3076558 RepID=UPI0028E973BB|nr:hypothetical protein [Paraflavitalea speifideiaquila]